MSTLPVTPAVDTTADAARLGAVRGLEGAFSELMTEFRRFYVQAAEVASPGMLPGTFKVLAAVARIGPITLSALAERLTADKGMMSRSVTELQGLGLIERTTDPADRRVRLIAVTPLGAERLDAARLPYEGRFFEVLESWSIESIEQLTSLLRALTAGETPEA